MRYFQKGGPEATASLASHNIHHCLKINYYNHILYILQYAKLFHKNKHETTENAFFPTCFIVSGKTDATVKDNTN